MGWSKCDCSGQHYCCAETTTWVPFLKRILVTQPKRKLHVLTTLGGGLLLSYLVGLHHLSGEWMKIPTIISILFTILYFTVVLEFCSRFKQHLATGVSREVEEIRKLVETKWTNCHSMICYQKNPTMYIFHFLYLTTEDQKSCHAERKAPVKTRV